MRIDWNNWRTTDLNRCSDDELHVVLRSAEWAENAARLRAKACRKLLGQRSYTGGDVKVLEG